MKVTPLQKKNRARIVEFLRTRVPEKRFDVGVLHLGEPKEKLPNLKNAECGTVGCAMGWTPECFPSQVAFVKTGPEFFNLRSKRNPDKNGWMPVAEELFGTDQETAYQLFNWDLFSSEPFVSGHACGRKATPTQVADRLEAYFKAHP